MNLSSLDSTEREERLHGILLAYVEAVEKGQTPDHAALLARHPEFSSELTEYFAAEAQVDDLAGPLRPLWPAVSEPNGTSTETVPVSSSRAVPLEGAFGEFDLLEKLGRGGMGVIYRARHRTLNREVALKVIRDGQLASALEVQRFRAEAESAAALDHPHIVPIYRVGEHQGYPYFTMKLIGGGSLADWLAEGKSPGQASPASPTDARWAAQLVATVARAVHHAHQHGILHRDLKPGNILLDAQGRPHVSDFGLAKRVEANTSLTETGLIVGTPAYMAPEQAAGRKQVLTTTDVYSLGVILYELLTGRRPFQGTEPLTILRQVMESEPEPPRALNLLLDVDLETVCLKCLLKEPEQRYPSALALAEDLERWLAGEPIQARRSRAWERGLKWVYRQPALAAALAGAGLSILGLIVLLGILWRNAEERAAERADHNRQLNDVHEELDQRQRELGNLEQTIDRRREEASRLHQSSRAAAREMRRALYIRDMHLARLALDNERTTRLLLLLERHHPEPEEEDFRGFEWRYLWGLCHRAKHVLRGHPDFVYRTVFTPDGKALLTVGFDGTLKLWDAASGKERPLPWSETGRIGALIFAPDGRTLVLGERDGRLRLRDWPDGKVRAVIQAHSKAVVSVGISPDGQSLVSGGEDGKVKLWDRESLRMQHAISDHRGAVTRTVFSPDGQILATISEDRSARLWDVASRRLLALFLDNRTGTRVADMAFSPDGKELAVVSMQPFSFTHHHTGSVQVASITADSVRIVRTQSIPGGGAFSVAYSPDGQTLVWGSNSGNIVLWDRVTAQVRDTLHGHNVRVHTLAFSPDGRNLASGGNDKTVRLWSLPPRLDLFLTKRTNQPCRAIALAPDGKRFAVAGANGSVSLRFGDNGEEEATLAGSGGQVRALAFTPDGRTLAVGNADGRVHVWDVSARKKRNSFTGPRQWISSLAFSPDGRTLAAASREENVSVWDMTFGWRRKIAVAGVWAAAFAPDGRTLALAGSKGIALCDPLTCQVRTTLPGSEGAMCVAFSPDGKRLVAGMWHGPETLKMWDLSGDAAPVLLPGHSGPVAAVCFTPDGRTILSASKDATVKLWDVATRLELFTLRNHHDSVGALELSADGQLLISSSEDGSVRLWRAPRQVAAR